MSSIGIISNKKPIARLIGQLRISLFLLTATSVTVVSVVTSISTTSAFRNVDLYWGHQCIAVSEGCLILKVNSCFRLISLIEKKEDREMANGKQLFVKHL